MRIEATQVTLNYMGGDSGHCNQYHMGKCQGLNLGWLSWVWLGIEFFFFSLEVFPSQPPPRLVP